jgi:hypothetical protein
MNAHDECLTMVEDCEQRESRLTEWEAMFIDSIKSQLQAGRSLTERQGDMLDSVWERVTQKG